METVFISIMTRLRVGWRDSLARMELVDHEWQESM